MTNSADRLETAIQAKGSPVCVGIDPRPNWVPQAFYDAAFEEFGRNQKGVRFAVRQFCLEVLELVAPHVPAVKP